MQPDPSKVAPSSAPSSTAKTYKRSETTRAMGLHVLQLLALGATKKLGPKSQQVEWGLGLSLPTGKYYIVKGDESQINWTSSSLRDLVSLAHTHPHKDIPLAPLLESLKNIDITIKDLSRDVLAQVLKAWLATAESLPLEAVTASFAPGRSRRQDSAPTTTPASNQSHFAYLFPSNEDIVSTYTNFGTRPESLFTPYRLGANGWLTGTGDGPAVVIEFGPARAMLNAEFVNHIRKTPMRTFELDESPVIVDEEAKAIRYLAAPITILARDLKTHPDEPIIAPHETVISSGFLQVDSGSKPLSLDGASLANAYYRDSLPPGLWLTRREVGRFLRTGR
jgi:hypothetical protein